MSPRFEPTTPGVEAAAGRTDGGMLTAIRARRDVDGCGCLDCRDVDAVATRRTVLDAAVWSLRLCRTYPSVPALAAVFVLAARLIEWVAPRFLPLPLVESLDLLVVLGIGGFLRAYVAVIAAGELRGHPVSSRSALRHCLGRTAPLAGLLVCFVGSLLLGWTLLTTVGFVPVLLAGISPLGSVGFGAVAAGLLVLEVLLLLFVLFKFWFAPEACVLGRYGPVDSLRVSWRVTGNYHRKFLSVLLSIVAGVGVLALVRLLGGPGSAFLTPGPTLTAVTTSLGEGLSVVWYGVYGHLYVQGVLES